MGKGVAICAGVRYLESACGLADFSGRHKKTGPSRVGKDLSFRWWSDEAQIQLVFGRLGFAGCGRDQRPTCAKATLQIASRWRLWC